MLLKLFVSFFKVGLFTFGGGYAMLPMLQREIIERHNWVTEEEILDYFALSQCTPGVIAVNTATFVGTKLGGPVGGAVATLAVVTPSLIIITIISSILQNFSSYTVVQHALSGVRVAVGALIINAVIKLYNKGVKGVLANAVFAAAVLLSVLFDLSPVLIVAAALVFGLLLVWKGGRRK